MSDPNAWQSADDRSAPSAPFRTMADLLFLPEPERSFVSWLLRQRTATLSEIAAFLSQSELEAQQLAETLIQAGFIQLINTVPPTYRPLLKRQQERKMPERIWEVLE